MPIVIEGKAYRVGKTTATANYFTCSVKDCPGRANFNKKINRYTVTVPHTCQAPHRFLHSQKQDQIVSQVVEELSKSSFNSYKLNIAFSSWAFTILTLLSA